jgi:hypothetical protein
VVFMKLENLVLLLCEGVRLEMSII